MSYESRMPKVKGDLFMVVSNEDCQDLYTDNTASRFKVSLDEYIDFTDTHSTCALLDIGLTTQHIGNQNRNIYICTNVVAEQRVGVRQESILRMTSVHHDKFQKEKFLYPYYMPLKPIRGNYLEIYIRDERGADASFLKGTTTCTLHFRKY